MLLVKMCRMAVVLVLKMFRMVFVPILKISQDGVCASMFFRMLRMLFCNNMRYEMEYWYYTVLCSVEHIMSCYKLLYYALMFCLTVCAA